MDAEPLPGLTSTHDFDFNEDYMAEQSNGTTGHGNAEGSLHASTLEASLTVNDVSKSISWYTGVLGFKVDQRHERSGKLACKLTPHIAACPASLHQSIWHFD